MLEAIAALRPAPAAATSATLDAGPRTEPGIVNLISDDHDGLRARAARLLSGLLDACLLSPDREGYGTRGAILVRCRSVTSWVEMSIDERVCRQKALRVVRRLEALHLPFPPPGWSMRVLCSII